MLIQFQKSDQIRHLGLLDLQRTMQRSLRRSGLPIAYSNGFNPHIVMSFASALSTGIPGDAEVLDVSLSGDTTEEVALQAMQCVLPPALRPTRLRLVDDRFPKLGRILSFASYRFSVTGGERLALAASIPAFLAQTEIMALRKSKSAETLINIRPLIHTLTCETLPDEVTIEATVSFTEAATLKPDLLFSTLCREANLAEPPYRVRRTGLYAQSSEALVSLMDFPSP